MTPGAGVIPVERGEPKLRIWARPADSERIYCTYGVRSASSMVVDGVAYRPGAIIPSADWQPADATWLAGDDHLPCSAMIDIVEVDPGILAAFDALGLSSAPTVDTCQSILTQQQYIDALQSALPLLEPLCASPDGLRLLGMCVQRGGLESTTTHDSKGAVTYSGLHVDDWDRLPIGLRHASHRQMCINLGGADRFFVFADVLVDEVGPALGTFVGEGIYTGIARACFRVNPSCRIWKVRIRPGEAYIAPTDNLIHDGCTLGTAKADVNLNLRGNFCVLRGHRQSCSHCSRG